MKTRDLAAAATRAALAVLSVSGLLLPSLAIAQTYPTKAIRLIVPFPPGGSTDLTGRVLGAKLGETFGQQVIVENRPGASGMIGNELVARATPDGYMLTMGTIGAMSVNQSLFKSVPYDSTRDFAPITLTGNVENLLVVHPSVPVHHRQGPDCARRKQARHADLRLQRHRQCAASGGRTFQSTGQGQAGASALQGRRARDD